jgi:DNA-binding CsgD family transcriptional regulator
MNASSITKYLNNASALATVMQSEILTMDDICQLIALTGFADDPPEGVRLFEVNSNGTYAISGSFGPMPLSKSDRKLVPLTNKTPVAIAIRKNQIVWVQNSTQMQEEFPGMDKVSYIKNAPSLVVIPIHRFGLTVGALGILDVKTSKNEDCTEYIKLLASLVSLKLVSQKVQTVEVIVASRGVMIGLPLTKREGLLQIMMSDGKTNREISEELGYSESTIRQDAVSLFAKLNVKTRKEAGDLLGHSLKE